MIERGPWKVKQSRDVYADPWIRVQIADVVRPDGNNGIHSIIHLKPGVCVLAMDAKRDVYLTEEFHYAVGRVTLEGVSGGIEAGETPLTTAQRELQEELGIVATQWTDLGVIDPFTANVVSPTRLFLAQDLICRAHEGYGDDQTGAYLLGRSDALATEGRITHGPTCVLLLKANLLCHSPRDASVLSRRHGDCERAGRKRGNVVHGLKAAKPGMFAMPVTQNPIMHGTLFRLGRRTW